MRLVIAEGAASSVSSRLTQQSPTHLITRPKGQGQPGVVHFVAGSLPSHNFYT